MPHRQLALVERSWAYITYGVNGMILPTIKAKAMPRRLMGTMSLIPAKAVSSHTAAPVPLIAMPATA